MWISTLHPDCWHMLVCIAKEIGHPIQLCPVVIAAVTEGVLLPVSRDAAVILEVASLTIF